MKTFPTTIPMFMLLCLSALLQLPTVTRAWWPACAFAFTSCPCRLAIDNAATTTTSLHATSKLTKTISTISVRNSPGYERFEEFVGSEIGLTDESQVMRIVQRNPSLLVYNPSRLNETFNMFRDMFDFTNEELRSILRKESKLFAYSTQRLRANINSLALNLFGGDMSATRTLIYKQPSTLLSKEETILPKVDYLREQVFEGNNTAAAQLFLTCPRILTLSLNGTIMARAEALRQHGIHPSHLIKTYSGLTRTKFEAWFTEKTGKRLTADDWSPSNHQPSATFDQRMDRIVDFLSSSELGMDRQDAIRLLERHPVIKQRSLDYVKEKISYLLDVMGGSKENVCSLLLKQPRIFTSSIEGKLKPVVAFWRATMMASGKDEETSKVATMDLFLRSTSSFATLSLEKRIKPRVRAIQAAGLDMSATMWATGVTLPENRFQVWLAKQSVPSDMMKRK